MKHTKSIFTTFVDFPLYFLGQLRRLVY